MSIPSTGQVSLSNIQSVMGGTNPIALSEYYQNASQAFTTGISGIPNINSSISLNVFRGKSSNRISVKSGGTIIPQNIPNTNEAYLSFPNNGSQYSVEFLKDTTIQLLIVAGGGSGGRNPAQNGRAGGGGGAGGLLYYESYTVTAGTYTIIVGAGGSGQINTLRGNSGANSSFGSIVATGGGGGGGTHIDGSLSGTYRYLTNGANGGSGGGAGSGFYSSSGGTGTSGQGNSGGNNSNDVFYGSAGSGGGGAGGAALSWSPGVMTYPLGTPGGAGRTISITGTAVTYAKGGDGGNWDNSNTPINGAANTGNGGDGVGFKNPGTGGSGIVIIRYGGIYTQWQYFNNSYISDGEYAQRVEISKSTITMQGILNNVLANPEYIAVYVYDGPEISSNTWQISYISKAFKNTVSYTYQRYGSMAPFNPNNRYVYIHVNRATAEGVYVQQSYATLV